MATKKMKLVSFEGGLPNTDLIPHLMQGLETMSQGLPVLIHSRWTYTPPEDLLGRYEVEPQPRSESLIAIPNISEQPLILWVLQSNWASPAKTIQSGEVMLVHKNWQHMCEEPMVLLVGTSRYKVEYHNEDEKVLITPLKPY